MTTPQQRQHQPSSSSSSKNLNMMIHLALIAANAMFGLGSIIGALGLPATNPLAFTFFRELFAGLILLSISYCVLAGNNNKSKRINNTKTTTIINDHNDDDDSHDNNKNMDDDEEETALINNNDIGQGNEQKEEGDDTSSSKHSYCCNYYYRLLIPQWEHYSNYMTLGLLLFANQSAYIVGIETAGPVTGSVWQPSTPIFTAALSMIWQLEAWNISRIVGVIIAFGGCAAMVLLSDRNEDTAHGGSTSYIIGNFLFFTNCLCTAFYILLSKQVLKFYPSLTVIAWSYLLASPWMFLSALVSAHIPAFGNLICPACAHSLHTFEIPNEALPALLYYIIAMSVGSWGLIVWSNQYATGTLVMGYTVLQPVTAIIFTTILLLVGLVAQCSNSNNNIESSQCLNEPGIGTFCGMIGVACGLTLIISTEPRSSSSTTTSTTTTDTNNNSKNDGVKEDTEYGSITLQKNLSDLHRYTEA